MTIDPGSSGWAGWKEALWTLNYLQVMHDSTETAVSTVPAEQLALVGTAGNTILGADDTGAPTVAGDVPRLERHRGLPGRQLPPDPRQPGAAVADAAHDDRRRDARRLREPERRPRVQPEQSPLRWFPGSIAVTESAGRERLPATRPATPSPRPTATCSISPGCSARTRASTRSPISQHRRWAAASPRSRTSTAIPSPSRTRSRPAQPTLHDRALAMMRVLVVNIDRLHVDPATGLLVDDVTLAGGKVVRGTTLSTDVAAYALLALRTARRALDSCPRALQNTKPDAQGVPCPLDAFPPLDGVTFGARLDAAHRVAVERLLRPAHRPPTATPTAAGTSRRSAPTDDGSTLDAHTAAIRGLLVAYLATGDTRYRDRAASVFARLDSAFYDPRRASTGPSRATRRRTVTFTPRRFGILQGALRDTYELIAVLPGQQAMQALDRGPRRAPEQAGAQRLGRPRRGRRHRVAGRVRARRPRARRQAARPRRPADGRARADGRVRVARSTTPDAGDGGARVITTDREHDCVPEISAAGLPAALADSITFTLTPWSVDTGECTCNTTTDECLAMDGGQCSGSQRSPGAGVRRFVQRLREHADVAAGALERHRHEPRRRPPLRRPSRRRQRQHRRPDEPRGRARGAPRGERSGAAIPTTKRFDPAVSPRALALDSHGSTALRDGRALGTPLRDRRRRRAPSRAASRSAPSPSASLVSHDDAHVFVACSQDDEIVEVDAGAAHGRGHASRGRASRGPRVGRRTARRSSRRTCSARA